MRPTVITADRMNRAVLVRQRLVTRSRAPIAKVLESVGGLQTQYAPSGYVGLWSRMELPDRHKLTDALVDGRVIQGTLMRSTIHMVSNRDYPPMAAGVQAARREWWRRLAGNRELPGKYEAVAELVRARLESGPAPRAELVAALTSAGYPKEMWDGVGMWVDMVRVAPSGTWERRRADLYGLADHHVPGMSDAEETAGLVLLLKRYLAAFGPAPLADAANWAGVGNAAMQMASERLRLRQLADERGHLLYDLPGAPLPDGTLEVPVRFLPTWDAVLLVHARRSGVLPEEYRPLVFHTRNPQSVPTFLVDGRVAGTWRYQDDRVDVTAFEPLPPAVMVEVRAEADALTAFHLG
ncbi:MAG: winged helix DNA-binding domain-containing protein [Acidimicrobiia bacterium]